MPWLNLDPYLTKAGDVPQAGVMTSPPTGNRGVSTRGPRPVGQPKPSLEADVALVIRPREFDDLENYFWWTGWRRHHWPADLIRRGFRLYAFDKRPQERCLRALIEVSRGGAFAYRSKRDFSSKVRRLTGWLPDAHDPHFAQIPVPRDGQRCVGIAMRWKKVKDVRIPMKGAFPQLGWRRLVSLAEIRAAAVDAADLYSEGKRQLATHLRIERNAVLRLKARQYWKARLGGRLYCKACGFDFERRYGTHGADFVELHHVQPLGLAKRAVASSVMSLVPLCSNCHRMIHREPREPLSLNKLRSLIR